MSNENVYLYLACAAYGLGFALVYLNRAGTAWQRVLLLSLLGLALHSASLALRWERVGHGPFINLYEILSSNLWSLMLAYVLFLVWAVKHRSAARFIAPVLAVVMLWLLVTTPRDTYLPATYNTIWLYFHVVTGKFFLGLLMLSVACAIFEARGGASAAAVADSSPARSLSYRLLAFAFCFESLMLLFGAIWAQDAWGRYWAWDPLETWAFLTWLCVVFALHWRLKFNHRVAWAALVGGCFVIAFLTFFGVPFLSTAPHKGMV
ncbi:MAG: hypothetical protein EP300_04740 [Gammaproteobacteria bacterium]|nr:MAG: hypothetical protein EP300_04740 [Gammaproteobacteria bacterium]